MADKIYAPYARVVVLVDRDGTVLKQKNVIGASKADTGKYHVTVADSIHVPTAALQATPADTAAWGTEVYVRPVPNQDNVVQVSTGKNAAASDEPFYLTIH